VRIKGERESFWCLPLESIVRNEIPKRNCGSWVKRRSWTGREQERPLWIKKDLGILKF